MVFYLFITCFFRKLTWEGQSCRHVFHGQMLQQYLQVLNWDTFKQQNQVIKIIFIMTELLHYNYKTHINIYITITSAHQLTNEHV